MRNAVSSMTSIVALGACLVGFISTHAQAAVSQNTSSVQYVNGTLDYVQKNQLAFPGTFVGPYVVTFSNVGNLYAGEANNGLFVFVDRNRALNPPALDSSLTLFNGRAVTSFWDPGTPFPAPVAGSNPISLHVILNATNGLTVSLGRRTGPGVGGNVFVQIQKVGN